MTTAFAKWFEVPVGGLWWHYRSFPPELKHFGACVLPFASHNELSDLSGFFDDVNSWKKLSAAVPSNVAAVQIAAQLKRIFAPFVDSKCVIADELYFENAYLYTSEKHQVG